MPTHDTHQSEAHRSSSVIMSAAAYRAWAPTSTGSVSKTLWNPPTGGGPGTQPVKRGAKPGGGGGITGVKMAYPPAPAADKLKGGYTAESSSVEHKVIENLKKQVQLLEADNRALQELGQQAARGGGGGGAETRHAELAQQQREAELQAAAEQLRKEALAARLRERKALEEMSEAKEHLVQQREKFATARQELTAEVIAYQRDLDTLTQDKRQLQADLEDVKAELHSRQDFVQGVDAQVRLLESQLHEKAGEAARALGREAALKVELGEERVRLEQVKDKYENLRAAQGQMEGMRASQQATSERATAELRLCDAASARPHGLCVACPPPAAIPAPRCRPAAPCRSLPPSTLRCCLPLTPLVARSATLLSPQGADGARARERGTPEGGGR